MENKKSNNWPLKLLGALFFLYLSLTIAMESGYYEAKLSEKTTITKEAMERFEEDVRLGKEVDITDYVTDIHQDYSNSTTKAGVYFSSKMEDLMSEGISKTIDILKKLFT